MYMLVWMKAFGWIEGRLWRNDLSLMKGWTYYGEGMIINEWMSEFEWTNQWLRNSDLLNTKEWMNEFDLMK